MAKMKLKKRIKNLKKVVMLALIVLFFYIGYNLFFSIKLFSTNEDFIVSLLNDSNYYKKYEYKNIVTTMARVVYNVDAKKPITLIENVFNYKSKEHDEAYNPDELIGVSNHIADPNPNKEDKPLVYIYNSHQLENYSNSNYEAYNITPNVMMASYLLKEKLNKIGVPTIVEESNFAEFIRMNNWDYNYSYAASRYFMKAAKNEYPSIKYFIDIHRDSINKSASTIKINGKNYAKILFVIGLEHSAYSKNLNLANTISAKINKKYNNLSRGVMTKKGPDVNGIYNQDLSPNAILIELGGYENKVEEVLNTVGVLSEILKEIINERG